MSFQNTPYKIGLRKAINEDFRFIQSGINDDNTPDFNGFCTKQAREAGQSKKFKTNVLFKPLINKPPSDPSTILTAMYEVERITKEAGKTFTIFTCDQQLYRVCMDIIWASPLRVGVNFILVLVGCTN